MARGARADDRAVERRQTFDGGAPFGQRRVDRRRTRTATPAPGRRRRRSASGRRAASRRRNSAGAATTIGNIDRRPGRSRRPASSAAWSACMIAHQLPITAPKRSRRVPLLLRLAADTARCLPCSRAGAPGRSGNPPRPAAGGSSAATSGRPTRCVSQVPTHGIDQRHPDHVAGDRDAEQPRARPTAPTG